MVSGMGRRKAVSPATGNSLHNFFYQLYLIAGADPLNRRFDHLAAYGIRCNNGNAQHDHKQPLVSLEITKNEGENENIERQPEVLAPPKGHEPVQNGIGPLGIQQKKKLFVQL
jgi:hypothetical protein